MSLAMTFTSNFRLLAVIKQAVSAMSLALSFALTLSVISCLTYALAFALVLAVALAVFMVASCSCRPSRTGFA
jgi:hypothetical protein